MISTIALTLAAASLAAAEQVTLYIASDNDSVNGNSIGFSHAGAGIDYGFLGTADSSVSLDYDESAGSLSQPFVSGSVQSFSVDNKYVALTVAGSNSKFSFNSENTLLVDGSDKGFYACKNTGDPYNMSTNSYELMFYKSDAPSDCIEVTVVSKTSGTPAEKPVSSSSAAPSATPSVFEDAAMANMPQAAAGAAALGLIAALI